MSTDTPEMPSEDGWGRWLLSPVGLGFAAVAFAAFLYVGLRLVKPAVPAECRSVSPNERRGGVYSGEHKANMMKNGLYADYREGTYTYYYAGMMYLACLEDALRRGADVNARNYEGNTPLHNAAEVLSGDWQKDLVPTMKLLIRAGADVNARNFRGRTPLHTAVLNKNANAAQLLLDAGADPLLVDELGLPPYALADSDWPASRYLFPGMSWPTITPEEEEILKVIGNVDDPAQLERLLSREDASVDTAEEIGYTPLMRAAHRGEIERIVWLVEHGANVNKREAYGCTALYYAVRWAPDNTPDNTEAVTLLLNAGANVELADALGRSPLWWAACMGQTEVVKLLLDAGADVNARDIFGWTPLGWVQHYDPAMAELLKTHGAIALEPPPVGAQ